MSFVAAVLLAAGESTRMGRQKALLPWKGTTLLEYQLKQLSGVDDIGQIIVVTGHEPEPITEIVARFERTEVVHNPLYSTGKVSSITAGLDAISREAEAIVLIAVDQPRPERVVQRLVERHLEVRPAITAPAHAGRRGHPLVFAGRLLPELRGISEASLGVRAVMERHRGETLEVEIDDGDIFVDLNLPSDLETQHRGA